MSQKKSAFLFPGQGAQVVGMGKDFYEAYTVARELFQQGDELLGFSLSKVIFEGPTELLTQTRHAQLGIYITSLAILAVIKQQFPDLKPAVCAGLSLGEYTALTASGKLTFEQCLPLVQKRAEAMNAACEASQGGMAALFGLDAHQVELMVAGLNLTSDLWVANFNCPGQTVISGTQKGVEAGIQAAKTLGARRAIPLKVHGAFHSGLMEVAKQRLTPEIESLSIAEGSSEIVMNVPGDYVTSASSVRSYMIQQVTSPVRWEQGVRKMMPHIELFIEIGCGKTLAGMNKQIGVQAPTLSINSIADLEHYHEYEG